MNLIPAYGRDYKSKKALMADFDANKDFLIADISCPDDGRYVNKEQLKPGTMVQVRYKRLTQVTVFTVK